jgi:hypothetical protein
MTCYCGIRLSAAMALHREWYNLQGPPHGTNCSNVVEQSQIKLGVSTTPSGSHGRPRHWPVACGTSSFFHSTARDNCDCVLLYNIFVVHTTRIYHAHTDVPGQEPAVGCLKKF